MALPVGSLGYIDYGEGPPQVIHCRLILDHIENSEHVICTPDMHIYVEDLNAATNVDIVQFWAGRANGALPAGVPPGAVYGFAPMNAGQLARIMHQGRAEGDRVRASRGLAGGAQGGAAAVAAPAVPVAAQAAGAAVVAEDRAGLIWVLAEMVMGHKVGERVHPPNGHAIDGEYGLMRMIDSGGEERPVLIRSIAESELPDFCDLRVQLARATESCEGSDRSAAEDVRTLDVKYGYNGERQRSFRESVKELQMTEFEDFPLQPRTTLDYMRAIAGIAESATAQHHIWVNSSGIPAGDRSVYEDQVLARILDEGLCYDSLNVCNLSCIELVCRRRQLLADAHSNSPGVPSYLGAEHYLGETYKMGGGIVVPSLTEHVSRKMQAQSQIMKEKRKLAEAAKGGKKGNPKDGPPKAPPKGKESGGVAG